MEAYDLSHKLAYAGRHSPVPFTTGPEYTNSVPGVPVLSMLRIFVDNPLWTTDNIKTLAREVARVLGPTEQYDIGITMADVRARDPSSAAAGSTARLTKLDANDPHVILRISQGVGDETFRARYPRLVFEPIGENYWRAIYAPGAVKVTSEP